MSNLHFPGQPTIKDIVKTVGDCIARAPGKEQAALATAIEKYAERFPSCWDRLMRDNKLLSELLCEMEERSDARIGLHAMLGTLDAR